MKLAIIFYNTKNLGAKTLKTAKKNGLPIMPRNQKLQDSFKKTNLETQDNFFAEIKTAINKIFNKNSPSKITPTENKATELTKISTSSNSKNIIFTNSKDGTKIKANIQKTCEKEGIETFSLYDDSNELIGFTKIADNPNYSNSSKKGTVYVELMEARKPNYGIGTRLHQIAIERSHQLGYEGRVILDAGLSSHAFHYKSGFRPQYGTNGELSTEEITKSIKEALKSDKEKQNTEFIGNVIMSLSQDSLHKWNKVIEKNPILK